MEAPRRVALALAILLMGATAAMPASAQAPYPSRSIRIVVPYTAGTGIDILARVTGQKLSERLKAPVIVDNRPGASGNIGTEAVSKASPDGYTLLMTASTHVTNAALQASVPYDPAKSFTPIGPTAIGNLALVVHLPSPRERCRSWSRSRRRSRQLNYASPRSGTHHSRWSFQLHFSVDLTPFRTRNAGAVTDLLGGQVQVMFLIHVALGHAQAGSCECSPPRRQSLTRSPDVPSLADGRHRHRRRHLVCDARPAGLPKEQVALLNAEMNAILADPEVRETC
jgi:tripartite-type tricarboxylate transporter receptor subunit TctC